MTNTIQNQRIFTLTILNRVMIIASAIKIFIIAPIAQQAIITLATIQNIITEFGAYWTKWRLKSAVSLML